MSTQLGKIGEPIKVKLAIGDKKQVRITQGFEEGDIALIPKEDWVLTEWLLIHKPTGFLLNQFHHEDLRLARMTLAAIAQWDWRGSDQKLIPAQTRKKWAALYAELQLDKSTPDLREEFQRQRKTSFKPRSKT